MYLVENEMNAMSKKEPDACIEESLVCDDALRIEVRPITELRL